jgi:predicted metallopeptidase
MEYVSAEDVKQKAEQIVRTLDMKHIDMSRVHFLKSKGSKSKWVQARIHSMGRVLPHALGIPPHYVIEVISEKYDKLANESQEKVIIHELLHIPRRFSGGLVCHGKGVNRNYVEQLHR